MSVFFQPYRPTYEPASMRPPAPLEESASSIVSHRPGAPVRHRPATQSPKPRRDRGQPCRPSSTSNGMTVRPSRSCRNGDPPELFRFAPLLAMRAMREQPCPARLLLSLSLSSKRSHTDHSAVWGLSLVALIAKPRKQRGRLMSLARSYRPYISVRSGHSEPKQSSSLPYPQPHGPTPSQSLPFTFRQVFAERRPTR